MKTVARDLCFSTTLRYIFSPATSKKMARKLSSGGGTPPLQKGSPGAAAKFRPARPAAHRRTDHQKFSHRKNSLREWVTSVCTLFSQLEHSVLRKSAKIFKN
jgi:hypothetical protein